jgi:hypothetical protein
MTTASKPRAEPTASVFVLNREALAICQIRPQQDAAGLGNDACRLCGVAAGRRRTPAAAQFSWNALSSGERKLVSVWVLSIGAFYTSIATLLLLLIVTRGEPTGRAGDLKFSANATSRVEARVAK